MRSISTREFEGMEIEEAFKVLGSSPEGLSEEEARKRLAVYGFNEVPERKENPALAYLRRYWGPLPWLMEAAIAVSYAAGRLFETEVMLFLLVLNATLGFAHERSSKRVVELLRKQLRVEVSVRRDGKWRVVDARELVPGDVVLLRLGSAVPADVKVFEGRLLVDQSALTGESLPVEVGEGGVAYAGSIVRSGEAKCLVVNTGARTFFGRTVELVKQAKARSQQERVILAFTRYMMVAGIAALLIALPVALAEGWPPARMLDLAVTILMGAVPVALPAVLTIMQAYAALELSRRGVLVTRLSAAEDAGAVSVACFDKTGTLTENKLQVVEVKPFGFSERDVLLFASLAASEGAPDPIDEAVLRRAREAGVDRGSCRIESYTPFDPHIKRSEAVAVCGGRRVRVAMGEPRTIVGLCGAGGEEAGNVLKEVEEASRKGLRTLAVAVGEDGGGMRVAGLLHLLDPPRRDSAELLAKLRELGVRPVMLTGDNALVAREVARMAGVGERVVSVKELRERGASLEEVVDGVDGLAEVFPEDKFNVVKAFQSRGYVVAMTGDGVNDAPALSQAEVGIAVAGATDAAKAAASMVLLEEGLKPIVDAVTVGRVLHERALTWVLNKAAKTLQTVVVVLAGMLWLRRLALEPYQMALLLAANDFLTMSISTDNARPSKRPARWDMKPVAALSAVLAAAMSVPPLLALAVSLGSGMGWERATAAVLLSLIYTSQFRLLMVRERGWLWSSKPSRAVLLSIAGTFAAFTALALAGVLMPRFSAKDILEILGISSTCLLAEPVKVRLAAKLGLRA
ncbi:MAG: plasma-membrane proton-efflux P-type ATPase [Thermofilum sp.]|nr:plasma-membrane proton-efflux P-type ATPase [Thermofilum sp.]